MTDHMSATHTDVIEDTGEVASVVGEAVAAGRLVAVAASAQIVGDHAEVRRQRGTERVPAGVICREAVHGDDRASGTARGRVPDAAGEREAVGLDLHRQYVPGRICL
jgi:hypothetical protein